jgi:hypothetical protein
MNKLAHGLILLLFGVACVFVWGCFKLPLQITIGIGMPAFVRLCMGIGPQLVVAGFLLAAAYCLWVWCRKSDAGHSWVAFLAAATSTVVLLMLPALFAVALALISSVNRMPTL